MKYCIDLTIYKLAFDRKVAWEQLGETELLFETDDFDDALEFFDTHEVESFKDHGKTTLEITRPALIHVISFLEQNGRYTNDLGHKYLEKQQ
jgi:hypothetical protein